METSSLFYSYWGKARPDSSASANYHLLPYHCLDVAAVAFEYLSRNQKLSGYFCQRLQCSLDQWLAWASFWMAIHDTGKFSEAFQSQKPEIVLTLQGREPNPEKLYTKRHDSLGYWLWREWLCDIALEEMWFGGSSNSLLSGLDFWAGAVTGHHGQPPEAPVSPNLCDFFTKGDRMAVQQLVTEIRPLLLPESSAGILTSIDEDAFERESLGLSWLFSGIAVLADWLGSNTTYFPYVTEQLPLDEYWKAARAKAYRALEQSGITYRAVRSDLSFTQLFPHITVPTPLQQWALETNVANEPSIHLLEDVTGAGKTEAALALAYRLMGGGVADGFFIGLPTMATANAMYDRLSQLYARMFEGNTDLVLAHGSKFLVEKFAASVVPETHPESDAEQEDETASARCASWLADHNKRALLAQAGVGTLDQSLLAVLHSRHQSIRLLGLFRKVLIIDEVHACDSYMQGVLEVLLEFHACAGGSVILLSATLPNHMKQSLLRAYAKGLEAKMGTLTRSEYPLVTRWSKGFLQPSELPVLTRDSVKRNVKIDYTNDVGVVLKNIKVTLDSERCVCWIRNTVADVLDAYELLRQHLPVESILIFHARFALTDRLAKEDKVLELFGPESSQTLRAGKLVIASQVIEQSLDVDFDLLISDLAPIDRLIQRAGRLRRHIRDASGDRLKTPEAKDQRGEARMLVLGPAFTNTPSANWYKDAFPKAQKVYPDHAQLWLTASALQSGEFSMPNDARDLMEGVFGNSSIIPEGLVQRNLTVQGDQMADASHAKANSLKFALGYRRGDVMDWWSEAKTPSRLGEPTINVILARWEGNKLVPWVQRNNAWAYSTVKIAERLLAKAEKPIQEEFLKEYERVLESLPDKGKWSVLLPLQSHGAEWIAEGWTAATDSKKAESRTWSYSPSFGFRLNEETTAKEEAE